MVLHWRKSGAAGTGVKEDGFDVDEDPCRNFAEVPVGVGEDGGGPGAIGHGELWNANVVRRIQHREESWVWAFPERSQEPCVLVQGMLGVH